MSNWIKPTTDEHTKALDAICLAECVWWGEGEELYRNWEHGIYEWRDLCYRVATWTHNAWEHLRSFSGECEWEIDTEFCPALAEHLLTHYRDRPYDVTCYSIQAFVDELTLPYRKSKAARLIEAKIKDKQEEIFRLEQDLQDLEDYE